MSANAMRILVAAAITLGLVTGAAAAATGPASAGWTCCSPTGTTSR